MFFYIIGIVIGFWVIIDAIRKKKISYKGTTVEWKKYPKSYISYIFLSLFVTIILIIGLISDILS